MKKYIRANEMLSKERLEVAKNPNTPAKVLELLAADADRHVRWAVAENPNTPATSLELLADDEFLYARKAVAENPNTPAKVLELLAADSNYGIRSAVAENLSTPAKLLELLADDDDYYVRASVAANRNTPAKILEILANDSEDYVRWSVAANRNTPATSLELLANDGDRDVREAVAKNPNTPPRLVETKSKKFSWSKLIRRLKYEAENGFDPLYEETSAGSELLSICYSVQDKLGIWLEPSIQGGHGEIWFYSSADDSTLASNYDFETFNDNVISLALESRNKTEFSNKYKDFIQSILDDPDYASEDDE